MRFWEFTMTSKTKWLTSRVVRVHEGNLEKKLLEMLPEWELCVSDRYPMRLLEVGDE